MLFERGMPFRHDWEAVLTPVIDVLVGRPDVDASALTGYGISQGGYWITRAVAFERRLVAAVADPGVVDVSAGWTAHLPAALLDPAFRLTPHGADPRLAHLAEDRPAVPGRDRPLRRDVDPVNPPSG
jgi:hypothetical protein